MATSSSPTDSGAPTPAPRSPRSRILLIGATTALLLAAVTAVVLANRDDVRDLDAQTLAAMQQVQQACQQWHRQSPAGDRPAAWCDDLAGWMHGQDGPGHMMWSDPQRLHDTCVAAIAETRPRVDRPAAACQDMVDWMARHPQQWMHGPSWSDWRTGAQ